MRYDERILSMESELPTSMTGVLAASGSRRSLVGVVLAGVLGYAVAPNAGAKKKRKKHNTAPSTPLPSSPPAPSPDPAPTGPTRGILTRIFANPASIAIPDPRDTLGGNAQGSMASPFPSNIVVSGLTNGVITDIQVHLNRLSHTYTPDIDMLVTATHVPVNALIMSDIGGGPVTDVTLVLDDAAPEPLGGPDTFSTVTSGTFRPANGEIDDPFPAPAPAPSGNSELAVFRGYDPNGIWQLFICDDVGLDSGTLAGGWALEITAEVDLPPAAVASSVKAKVEHGNEHERARRKGKKRTRTNGPAHDAKVRHRRQH
jgi:hypothetical protein